jgi:HEAT repeat protein
VTSQPSLLRVWALTACLVLFSLAPALLAAPDPVEGLRQVLRVPVRNSTNRDELEYRQSALEKHSKAVTAIDDLRRALLLQEWRDQDRDELVARIDRTSRTAFEERLQDALRAVLDKGQPLRKQAAAALIGEMGISVRATGSRSGVMRNLAPDLIKRFEDEDGAVREAAARALGLVNPEPKEAAAALGKLLGHKDPATRRAAAEGLAGLTRTTTHMTRGRQTQGVELTPDEVPVIAAAVVPQAGRGLKDSEALVRRSCLEAIQFSASLLREMVTDPVPRETFPPPGRKLAQDEKLEIEQLKQAVEKERARLLPVAEALNTQLAAVGAALADEDLTTVELAGRALESTIETRDRLRQRAASVPVVAEEKDDVDRKDGDKLDADPLKAGLQGVAPAAAKLLSHKTVRGRLAAIYVLETLEADAAPAADTVTKALDDTSSFVRWGACRILNKVPAKSAAKAVPALAKLLDDENGDVRGTAVAVLEHCGPVAKEAVPALSKAIAHKDPTMRVPAIQALAAVGTATAEATAALVKALSDSETNVRRAAAEALGRLGPPAVAAEALRKAMRDPDADVRRAASAALLGAR